MLRGERLIKNQALIRELNEQVDQVARQLGDAPGEPGQLQVFCECANRSCFRHIPLTRPEYEALRRDPDAFLVVPGHEIPSIEQAVKRTGDYLIVVKIHPETTRIARARSQRAHF
jgi:hypothetical protein